jgi:hypothetical protein
MTTSLDQRSAVLALAALLPEPDRESVVDCWDIGECEGALELLVDAVAAHDIPLDTLTRARILVLAEGWDHRQVVEELLAACREAPEPEPAVVLLPPESPGRVADLPGHPLHGLFLREWMRCGCCARTLVCAYRDADSAEYETTAEHYAVLGDGAPRVHEEPEDALADLLARH